MESECQITDIHGVPVWSLTSRPPDSRGYILYLGRFPISFRSLVTEDRKDYHLELLNDGMPETRRRFVNLLLGSGLVGWLGSIIYPVFSFLKPPDVPEVNLSSINVGAVADFPNGSSRIAQFGRTPVLVFRTDTGEFRAFAGTCTHLDCIVQYRDDTKRIWCACHNGNYDLQGRVISGPPPAPLPAFDVRLVDDQIVISKPEQIA